MEEKRLTAEEIFVNKYSTENAREFLMGDHRTEFRKKVLSAMEEYAFLNEDKETKEESQEELLEELRRIIENQERSAGTKIAYIKSKFIIKRRDK